jgi:hypothetical protein
MFYNTTTIPTTILTAMETTFFSLNCLAGLLAIIPVWLGLSSALYWHYAECEQDDAEAAEQNEIINAKYWEELKALPDRVLSDQDLTNLQTKIVRETIESTDPELQNFDLLLTYHKESEAFWYFTDHLKEISYQTLESVARKFVIEYQCKRIYLQASEAGAGASEAGASEAQEEPPEGGVGVLPPNEPPEGGVANAVVIPPVRSVFAKFKKYNTGTTGGACNGGGGSVANYSNDLSLTTEQMNHFRYKGKLYQYEELLKQKMAEAKNITPLLDYAAYKLLMQAKKEN